MPNLISRLSRWYFSRDALPYWGILAIDCVIVLFSGMFVHVLNSGALSTLQNFWPLTRTYALYLLFYMAGFRIFRTYSGIIRYSSFVDLQRIAFAMLIGTVLIIALRLVWPINEYLVYIRIRDLIFTFILSTLLMWMVRVLVKYMYDVAYFSKQARRVFIYGVYEGGVGLAKSILNQRERKYVLEGFVSHEPSLRNRVLMGVRVYLETENLAEEMGRLHADILMVSPAYSHLFRGKDWLVKRLTEAGIHIYMVPAEVEWDGKSDVSISQLKEADIEDLLFRDKIEVDMEAVGRLLEGRKILITGAAGSIGSDIVRQIAQCRPGELVLVDQAETPMYDVRLHMAADYPGIKVSTIVTSIVNSPRMEEIFRRHTPDYVFHAAAYKHVPMMEDNPSECVRNNICGTRIVADLAVKYGAKKFVMISTDKAVNPTNVMGCSKRICEIYVQSLDRAIKENKVAGSTQFVTTRFGNVLGSNGSVIPLFREQIKRGGPVTVTHPDIIRYFMLIPEACKLVLEACTMGKGGEIFIFDMGKPVRIADLARQMILLSGAKDIEIKYIGLRDGEKLYEELLNNVEFTKPTFHPKIKIAAAREYGYADICRQTDELFSLSLSCDDMAIVKRMKEIVPEFKSRNSKYESLDGEA